MLEYTRDYLLRALEGGPDVIAYLLRDVPAGSAWDRHPEPGRFSLREITAHLAVWEWIFVDRIAVMRDQHEPVVPHYREEELAVVHAYANSIPAENLQRFGAGRAQLVQTLRELQPEQWERIGRRNIGPMSIGEQATAIAAHDSYHILQITQWLTD